jgi:flavin-dependent dehydrogenase
MAGKWAARAVDSGDMNVLSGYESEWRDHFGESLDRGYLRRRLLERHWDRLDEIIQYCWVAFREYHEPYEPYEPYEPPAGAGARDGME